MGLARRTGVLLSVLLAIVAGTAVPAAAAPVPSLCGSPGRVLAAAPVRAAAGYPQILPLDHLHPYQGVHGAGYTRYTVTVVDVLPDPGECVPPVTEAYVRIYAFSTGQLIGAGNGGAAGSVAVWDKVHVFADLDRPNVRYGAWLVIQASVF